jgi:filamentous hemagglutinin family protein
MARRQGTPRKVGILSLTLGLLGAAPAFGQSSIVLDGSLPNGRTDNVTALQPGPDYVIGEDLGWQVGRNLFHSFSKFSIATGQSATFTEDPALNSGLPPIGNVIARVTGGSPSTIDGLLRSTIPNADVFLLNPSGVLFGGQASIDVPASFTVSTAQQLLFAGGETLSTGVAANPVLSAAPPEAFGFLGGVPAADLEFLNTDQSFPRFYRVPDGETFTAIGGNVRVMNAQEPGLPPGQSSQLVAFGGRVQVAAAGSAAVVVPLDLATWKVAPDSSTHLGEVHLEKGALDALPLDPTGPQGEVVIRGGRLILADRSFVRGGGQVPGGPAVDIAVAKDVTLDLSELRTESLSEEPAGTLDVSASEIALRNQSLIQSSVFDLGGSAPGGDVSLEADRISIAGGSAIETTTSGLSPGGAIHLAAGTVTLDGATILSSTEGSGAAGDIDIRTGDLTLGGNASQILSGNGVAAPAGVSGGAIDVVASGTVLVKDGAVIASDTPGASAGGDIHIEAAALRIARDGGALPGAVRASVEELASGPGGSISIEAGNVTLDEGGQISTTTSGAGAAGAISIAASGGVLLQSEAIVGGVSQPSSIAARSETDADANSVSIAARTIDVQHGAQISTRAAGAGRSGDVTLAASDRISVQGSATQPSIVSARAVDGPGGNLTVSAPTLELLDGGRLDVSSGGAGLGGQIVANVGTLTVAGISPGGLEAEIAAEAQSAGDARGVAITASDAIHIGRGGTISASSSGLGGSPGDVALTAPSIEIDGGKVTTQTFGGKGGSVAISGGALKLNDGAEVTASSSGGDAGSIAISVARFISVDSQVSAFSPAFGGNVDIVANDHVNLVDSRIDATSQGGANGSGLAGGNITISPQAVVVNHSTLTANGFGNANGGNILLTADPLLVSGDSAITASSQFGRQGTIVVSSPAAEISGDLAVLPSEFLDASSLLEEACLAREDVSGTFTVRSVGVLQPPPDAPFAPDAGAGEQCQPQ